MTQLAQTQAYRVSLIDSSGAAVASYETVDTAIFYHEFTASASYYISVSSTDATLFDGGRYRVMVGEKIPQPERMKVPTIKPAGQILTH